MIHIPNDILTSFDTVLEKRAVPASRHADFRKWHAEQDREGGEKSAGFLTGNTVSQTPG